MRDKGCVIYLSNVRIPDNATAVSRLAEMVAMATLANNLSDLGSVLSSKRKGGFWSLKSRERGVLFLFFCSPVEWWILIENRTHVAPYRGLMHLGPRLERDGKRGRNKKDDQLQYSGGKKKKQETRIKRDRSGGGNKFLRSQSIKPSHSTARRSMCT